MSVQPDLLFGRQVIYWDDVEITRENVCDILNHATTIHEVNANQISHLYQIYKGRQAILDKIRPLDDGINNQIIVNFANQIVTFKTAYLLGKQIQYVSRGEQTTELSDAVSSDIERLNRFASDCDKAAKDVELAEWFHIGGTAYRLIMSESGKNDYESPFDIYTLDPRSTFVVYSNEVNHRCLMGVHSVLKANGDTVYNVWTRNKLFKIKAPVTDPDSILSEESHAYGRVPVIEYPANNARIGAFEIVLSLLDAINAAFSDLADGREQFINALLVIKGADIPDEDFAKLRQLGGIKVPSEGDVKYLVSELNQTQNGETINLMIDTMLEIVGMPKRSGGSGGTSDNGIAVYLRSGFQDAEARAADTERIFKKSENEFLRIALRICNYMRGMTLQLSSVEPHFTRQNTDNLLAKVQALTTMLATDKIHPRLAWQLSTLVSDPESAYTVSQEYEQQRIAQEEQMLADSVGTDHSDGDAE